MWRSRADAAAADLAVREALRQPPALGPVRLITVDGPSGAGKSTFADLVFARTRAAGVEARLVRTDDFATWEQPVQWWPRFRAGVLEPLSRGAPGRYRRVEWPGGVPVDGAVVEVAVPEVLLLEGVSSGRRSIADRIGVSVWVEAADPAARLERAVARDGESARAELVRWQEFERRWFASDRTRERADLVVHSG
ncbi:hypothetical protein FHR84_003787 [Actinopolyspora biskrensis]|uniref:(d)CMP kinase n=1 Tax=Actinopolyspora biskrensis TaxID=1470178 RepID=A0A852Z2M3_9ACTN|nr:hypothetical protein [Actinopolyspora biskrensis]NYH80430.1 hypothetical protein [Actinopolyspora biskrensis]